MKGCDCCGRFVATPYTHTFHDGNHPDMDYCQECYDAGCDLVTTCEVKLREHLLKEGLPGSPVRGYEVPQRKFEPSTQELIETYRSLGVTCPRHGGIWGDDETCVDCTDLIGAPKPPSNPNI